MASPCAALSGRVIFERHLAGRSRPRRGLDMRGGNNGRKRWRLQPASSRRRNEFIVVEELGVVNVGMLGQQEGEEVEVGGKLGGRGVSAQRAVVKVRSVATIGRRGRGGGGRRGAGALGRSWCRGLGPRACRVRMLRFGCRGLSVHGASERAPGRKNARNW